MRVLKFWECEVKAAVGMEAPESESEKAFRIEGAVREPCYKLLRLRLRWRIGYVRNKGKMSHKLMRLPNVKMEGGMLPLNELLYTYLRERWKWKWIEVYKYACLYLQACMYMCVCACMCTHMLVLAHAILTFYKWAEHALWITTHWILAQSFASPRWKALAKNVKQWNRQ